MPLLELNDLKAQIKSNFGNLMNTSNSSPSVMTEMLGERLKQARLNRNFTQIDVAKLAGVSRKVVLNAEKGKVQLLALTAIMMALGLEEHLNTFLPIQTLSPLQLSKLQGNKRQRASGAKANKEEGDVTW